MKIYLILAILFFISSRSFAQQEIQKGDMDIHIRESDAWGGHDFFVDIYIRQNSARIKYTYHDSIRFKDVIRDAKYKHAALCKRDDPHYQLTQDTIRMIIDKHSTNTRASTKINLKTDTAYKKLIQRIAMASKEELSPDINANSKVTGQYIIYTDPNFLSVKINTSTDKRVITVDAPNARAHPLLASLLKNTFAKKKNSNAVKKILQFYHEYR